MSHPPQPSRAEAQPKDAGVQSQEERLVQQLQAINLNDLVSNTESQHQTKAKLSAVSSKESGTERPPNRLDSRVKRDLLKILDKRRLEITRVNFTPGSSPSGKGSHGEVVVATLTLDDDHSSESGNQVAVKKFLFSDNFDEEKFLRVGALHVANWTLT